MPDPYELDLGPEPPRLAGSVVLRETEEDLHDALCADLLLQAGSCVSQFGDFQLLVAPTRACERVLVRLMTDPHYRELPWSRTRVWVANDDETGTGCTSLGELLLDHGGLPIEQLHGFAGGASAFERTLRETLEWREKGHDRFDFGLLSVDAAGHVAGMQAALAHEDSQHAVATTDGGGTVTLRSINVARYLAVLGLGLETMPGLRAIAAGEDSVSGAGIKPAGGVLRWYLDHAACGSPVYETTDTNAAERNTTQQGTDA